MCAGMPELAKLESERLLQELEARNQDNERLRAQVNSPCAYPWQSPPLQAHFFRAQVNSACAYPWHSPTLGAPLLRARASHAQPHGVHPCSNRRSFPSFLSASGFKASLPDDDLQTRHCDHPKPLLAAKNACHRPAHRGTARLPALCAPELHPNAQRPVRASPGWAALLCAAIHFHAMLLA